MGSRKGSTNDPLTYATRRAVMPDADKIRRIVRDGEDKGAEITAASFLEALGKVGMTPEAIAAIVTELLIRDRENRPAYLRIIEGAMRLKEGETLRLDIEGLSDGDLEEEIAKLVGTANGTGHSNGDDRL